MKLASIERVVKVDKHPNADKLDIVRVLGYDCIVGRDQYKEGEFVVFVQPDSLLPSDMGWASELLKYTSRGRIRSIRLRGSWSMGLVLNHNTIYQHTTVPRDVWLSYEEGTEVSNLLGITKYEPPLPKNAQAAGGLPFQIPKTDEDRYQNLREIPYGSIVDVSLKIDGCSFTAYCTKEHSGITSRSLDLRLGVDAAGNEFSSQWHEAEKKYNVLEKLANYCEKWDIELALRGEVYGTGIQSFEKNPHSKLERDIGFYSVYDIRKHRYVDPNEQHNVLAVCAELGLPTVPMLHLNTILDEELIQYYDNGTDTVNGKPFEGVVVRGQGFSFKIINKHYDAEK